MTIVMKTVLRSAVAALAVSATMSALAQTTETAEPEAVEAPALAEFDATTTLATVNGTELKLAELIALRAGLPEQYQSLPDEVLMTGLLDQLIDQTLMEKAARDAKLDQDLATALTLRNQERVVLAEAYMRSELDKRLTEDLIQKAYDEVYGGEPTEEVNAAHILVESEDLAKQIKAELDGGADFAVLAAQHGTDGTASRGGSLGWFIHGDMVAEFADAAFALTPGQISEPVQSSFGWHLIKLEDRRPRPAPPIEEVRDEIVNNLTQALQQKILTELREGGEVARTEPGVPDSAIRADTLLFGEQ